VHRTFSFSFLLLTKKAERSRRRTIRHTRCTTGVHVYAADDHGNAETFSGNMSWQNVIERPTFVQGDSN
jgi:hypothetical protein